VTTSTDHPGPIGLLLLDDHALLREGLNELLGREPDMEVLGEASSLVDALSLDLDPDVIVADLMLPDARGAAVVEGLHGKFPRANILVLTMVDNPTDVHLTFAAGARGYLLKEAASAELAEAIRRVASGRDYLQPAMGAAIAAMRTVPEMAHVSASNPLTDRETEVLRLIALGHTNAEIGSILHVAVRTVEHHRSAIMRKLGLRTRAELVRYATQHGLMTTD
jgi:two-component system, NarL family, response regulator NreC